jgi:hypothetical protein
LHVNRNIAHNQSSAFVVAPVSRPPRSVLKGPLQSALSFKVTERRVKRPSSGAKLGPSGGNGAGRPATFGYSQSHPARRRCSVLLTVLISNRGDRTERPSAASEPCAGADQPAPDSR